jgi:very-short-patch-repair endonuclease
MTQSDLEAELLYQLRAAGLPEPRQQFRFHPVRRWRADFAWCDRMLLAEADGGTLTRGRHTRPMGYEGDCEKLNAATLLGYRVLRFTAAMIHDGRALDALEEALKEA